MVDFVALVDQTTLAVALSIIGRVLNSSNQTSWIASGYFMWANLSSEWTLSSSALVQYWWSSRTSTSFQLLYGRLSDIWSRKHVLYAGLALFFIGSLASSFSTSAIQLIVFRAITGIGGGGLMTVAQIIVSDVVSLRDRGRYQGILVSDYMLLYKRVCTERKGCCCGRLQWHRPFDRSSAGVGIRQWLVCKSSEFSVIGHNMFLLPNGMLGGGYFVLISSLRLSLRPVAISTCHWRRHKGTGKSKGGSFLHNLTRLIYYCGNCRKLIAVDVFGAALTLLGSTLLIVCPSSLMF